MGHLTHFCTYDYGKTEKQQKENIQIINYESNQWAVYNSDCHSDLPGRIDFNKNRVFDSYDEACEYLDNHDGFYYQGAVLYKQHESKSNAKSERIQNKIKSQENKITTIKNDLLLYVKKNDVKNRKSIYVGCSKCGSKLHKDYIRLGSTYQNCPLCGENLFSETVKTRIAKYQADIKEQEKIYRELQKDFEKSKQTGKFEMKWCVKLEIHV